MEELSTNTDSVNELSHKSIQNSEVNQIEQLTATGNALTASCKKELESMKLNYSRFLRDTNESEELLHQDRISDIILEIETCGSQVITNTKEICEKYMEKI